MKVLLTKNFKAKYVGEFVDGQVNESRGDFVLDTSIEDQFAFSTLQEIAQANGFKLAKGKKSEALQKIEEEIVKLNLKEINQMTDSEKVEKIVADGVAAGKSDDEMIIEIVQSGIKFKAAGRLFAKAMTEGGYRISASKRQEEVTEILTEAEFEPTNDDGEPDYSKVEAMVKTIVEKVNDTDEVQATRLIKKFCKENEMEFPKRPPKPKGGLLKRFQEEAIKNPNMTQDDLVAWLEDNTKPEKVEAFTKKFTPWLEFANDFAAAKADA